MADDPAEECSAECSGGGSALCVRSGGGSAAGKADCYEGGGDGENASFHEVFAMCVIRINSALRHFKSFSVLSSLTFLNFGKFIKTEVSGYFLETWRSSMIWHKWVA